MKRADALKLTADFRLVLEEYFQQKSYTTMSGRHWRGLEPAEVAKEVISVAVTNERNKIYVGHPHIIHAQYTIKAKGSSHLFPNLCLLPHKNTTNSETFMDVISNFFKHGEVLNLYFCPLENIFTSAVKAYGKFFHLRFSFNIQKSDGPSEKHPSGLSGEHNVVLDAIHQGCLGGI